MIPTPHIIESALLLLVAFVLGCAIGHILRRFFPRVPVAAPPDAAAPAEVATQPDSTIQAASIPAATPASPARKRKAKPAAAAFDDLKKIKGIGPKFEALLHANGVTTMAQIAAWERPDIDDLDTRLDLRGRIDRDGWVDQARALVAAR